RSIMEDHPDLSDGWYRFLITENVFEYGVNLTIELRYTGEMTGGRVVMNKLIFNPRTIHLDVFHKSDIEVLMYNDVEGKGTQISPTQSSSGSGDPTKFTYESTLSLVVQEEGTDEIDWAQYGRYALLGLLIAVLLILVLWSGRGKGSTEREEEEEDPEVAEERAELEARKAAILAQIKELDRRHDEGELGKGVWNRKRKALKGRAVEVMRELEELDGAPPDVEDLPEATGERAELLAEKEEILDRIRDLDHRHDEGVISDETWKRKRKHLKAEAVEIMQEIEALDEE
ncbi:MAG: hypothetical protein KAJ35_06820, partial [Thermoplasmata archaeon]|nr:hypothetical protein [Thermoplasmata archaeon]